MQMVEGHVNKHFSMQEAGGFKLQRRKNLGVLKGLRDLIPSNPKGWK
jgi:hypothetical protein